MAQSTQMSRSQSQSVHPIAKRLRFLRGEETQESFAKRVGVSRSALANYETGRSKPDDFTLAKIAENAGVPDDYFSPYTSITTEQSLAASIGQYVEGVPDWTDDEAVFIRVLRLCGEQTTRDVLQTIADEAAKQEITVTMSTIYALKEDFEHLLDLASGTRPFQKGPLAFYAEDSPLHRIGFKNKAKAVPQ